MAMQVHVRGYLTVSIERLNSCAKILLKMHLRGSSQNVVWNSDTTNSRLIQNSANIQGVLFAKHQKELE